MISSARVKKVASTLTSQFISRSTDLKRADDVTLRSCARTMRSLENLQGSRAMCNESRYNIPKDSATRLTIPFTSMQRIILFLEIVKIFHLAISYLIAVYFADPIDILSRNHIENLIPREARREKSRAKETRKSVADRIRILGRREKGR